MNSMNTKRAQKEHKKYIAERWDESDSELLCSALRLHDMLKNLILQLLQILELWFTISDLFMHHNYYFFLQTIKIIMMWHLFDFVPNKHDELAYVVQDLQPCIYCCFVTDFYLYHKLQLLWLRYCTWPYCDFDNMAISLHSFWEHPNPIVCFWCWAQQIS